MLKENLDDFQVSGLDGGLKSSSLRHAPVRGECIHIGSSL
jgi:hypothetical protein